MAIQIKHEPEERYGAFRAYDDEGCAGSMVYVKAGEGVIIIQHTGTEPRARGQGLGGQLFHFMVAWAREHETKVVVQCPYVRKQFLKHPELQDVIR